MGKEFPAWQGKVPRLAEVQARERTPSEGLAETKQGSSEYFALPAYRPSVIRALLSPRK